MSKKRIMWTEEALVAKPDGRRPRREAQLLNLVCRTLQEYPEAYRAVQEAIRRNFGDDDEWAAGGGHGTKKR